MNELESFRAEKNDFFNYDPQSPLTKEQKRAFTGLNYFPESVELRLEVKPEEYEPKESIEMQTSTGDVQVYVRHSRIRFRAEGQDVELTIYESENGFFLPFVDSLAGTETYPAGRYLEPDALPGGNFRIDFNLAYNPYCAYNERWSCPVSPFENRLKIPIRAGEKLFDQGH